MRVILIGLTLLTVTTVLVVNAVQAQPIQAKSYQIRPQCLPPSYQGETNTPLQRLCASMVRQRLADLLWAEQRCKNENEVLFNGQASCKELKAQAVVLKTLVVSRMKHITSAAESCVPGSEDQSETSCLELSVAQSDLKPIYDKVTAEP